jgi:hypothetical protein
MKPTDEALSHVRAGSGRETGDQQRFDHTVDLAARLQAKVG